jgi:hypothetical protein
MAARLLDCVQRARLIKLGEGSPRQEAPIAAAQGVV